MHCNYYYHILRALSFSIQYNRGISPDISTRAVRCELGISFLIHRIKRYGLYRRQE
jgi:hypothetical protein